MNQPETSEAPETIVPMPLKILVYTMFGLLVVAAIAVTVRFVTHNNAKDERIARGDTIWEVNLDAEAGETIASAVLDGKMLTVVIKRHSGGERVVLVDTKRGVVVGTIALVAD